VKIKAGETERLLDNRIAAAGVDTLREACQDLTKQASVPMG